MMAQNEELARAELILLDTLYEGDQFKDVYLKMQAVKRDGAAAVLSGEPTDVALKLLHDSLEYLTWTRRRDAAMSVYVETRRRVELEAQMPPDPFAGPQSWDGAQA